jgi:hypothetical protein
VRHSWSRPCVIHFNSLAGAVDEFMFLIDIEQLKNGVDRLSWFAGRVASGWVAA